MLNLGANRLYDQGRDRIIARVEVQDRRIASRISRGACQAFESKRDLKTVERSRDCFREPRRAFASDVPVKTKSPFSFVICADRFRKRVVESVLQVRRSCWSEDAYFCACLRA